MFEIVIATTNSGKLTELQRAFHGLPISLRFLSDFEAIADIVESGSTFAENAVLKAIGYAGQTDEPSLADDSGLEVDALDLRPGVHSARYGGDVGYDKKIEMLLAEIPEGAARSARFKCAIALASASGELIKCVEASCEGRIAREARGGNGFGYDPVFIPDGFDETFGELPDEIKQVISHRARACIAIKPYLRWFISVFDLTSARFYA